MKTKRDLRQRVDDLGIFEVVSSRSKLRGDYRRYDGLNRKRKMCTDQVTPALIEGMRHHRMKGNIMERMSKRNNIIGVRELIGGDRCPRK